MRAVNPLMVDGRLPFNSTFPLSSSTCSFVTVEGMDPLKLLLFSRSDLRVHIPDNQPT